MDSNEFAEVVYVFGEAELVAELRFRDFERHVDQQKPLPVLGGDGVLPAGFAKAAFVVVGAGPRICGLAFFLFELNDAGVPAAKFNMPLAYLVRNASDGPSFGDGRVRMACRGQCPVPWQANNLWDPLEHPNWPIKDLLSQAVQQNRLGLQPRRVVTGPTAPVGAPVAAGRVLGSTKPVAGSTRNPRSASPIASQQKPLVGPPGDLDVRVLAQRLEAMMVGQTNELLRLQAQHEQDLLDRAAMHELQIDLYKKQIQRLKEQLAHAQR